MQLFGGPQNDVLWANPDEVSKLLDLNNDSTSLTSIAHVAL
ncbi:MAG TPA: hypothetical protein VKK79_18605 [Candidatus Lokiarchaeia archaeon]|nr:hypothetical protein [Candidatus Lokiarchaeia archaeon]